MFSVEEQADEHETYSVEGPGHHCARKRNGLGWEHRRRRVVTGLAQRVKTAGPVQQPAAAGTQSAARIRSEGHMKTVRKDSFVLPDAWYSLTIADGADSDFPGLYEFEIEGVGSYIGKYTNLSQRRKL